MSEHKTKRTHSILMFIFALILGFVLASFALTLINSTSCKLVAKERFCYHSPSDTLYTVDKAVKL